MHWFLLVLAGLLEVGWAIGLKSSHGFTRFWPSVATLVLMALSFFLLASALKHLPIGTAYAVWTGIGAARHRPFRRIGIPGAPSVHRADPRGHRRAETAFRCITAYCE